MEFAKTLEAEIEEMVVISRDDDTVTLKRTDYETLRWAANHDSKTSLANSYLCDKMLSHDLSTSRRNRLKKKSDHNLCVLYVDLDGLKYVNDNFGHSTGDHLLEGLGNLMQNIFQRETDTKARWGGDEFAIILPQTDYEIARIMAGELEHAARKENISISVGIANYAMSVDDPIVEGKYTQKFEDVLANLKEAADKDLYAKKRSKYEKIGREEYARRFYNQRLKDLDFEEIK